MPGGGAVAEVVRELDRIHGLGEEGAHWLAIQAMDVMGGALRALLDLDERPGLSRPSSQHGGDKPGRTQIHDCLAFARADEARAGALPHSWDVTSDSIAARAAVVFGARRLVLLKSVDGNDGTSWDEWAWHGWVDTHFPRVVRGAAFVVEVVNLRRMLDSLRE